LNKITEYYTEIGGVTIVVKYADTGTFGTGRAKEIRIAIPITGTDKAASSANHIESEGDK
jgi:hypothetical protein